MGLAGEASQEKVFVLCFCVWRVGHRFSEGVCKVGSSKPWVFPGGSPRVGAGLSALLCHWGRWRPARAGGKDGKG